MSDSMGYLLGETTPFTFRLIGHGVYSIREAYRLTRVPPKRIRRWTQGYSFAYRGETRWSEGIVAAHSKAVDGSPILTFADLLEVRFLEAFRNHGVSWRAIRIASERAQQMMEHEHPFSTKKFRTDGRTIMAAFVGETDDPILIDLVQNQYEFNTIITPLLYAGIEFGPDDEPDRWHPVAASSRIVIDPARSFGNPIVKKEGVPTRVLADSAIAEDSIELAAAYYRVDPISVAEAVEFEASLPG